MKVTARITGRNGLSPGGTLGLVLLLGLLLVRLEGFFGFCCLFSVGLYISSKLRRVVAEHERVRTAAETFT